MELNFRPDQFDHNVSNKILKDNIANSKNSPSEQSLFTGDCEQVDAFTPSSGTLEEISVPISGFVERMKNVNNRLQEQGAGSVFGLTDEQYKNATDIKTRSDGKITDFYVEGKRYSIRYDENGNVTKTFTQDFDENGNITNQNVTNYFKNGLTKNNINYDYSYDESGNRTQERKESLSTIELLNKYFNFDKAENIVSSANDIQVDSNGNITDFYLDGTRYSLRYDEDGNVEKTIIQEFNENGTLKKQTIDDNVGTYNLYRKVYNYDENGVQVGQPIEYTAADIKDMNAINSAVDAFSTYWGGVITTDSVSDIKMNNQGKITDFYVGEQRYSLRYDNDGNVVRAIKQTFHENGNIANQYIQENIGTYSETQKEYTYDENGEQIGQPKVTHLPSGWQMCIN